jgi:hypothetical protein
MEDYDKRGQIHYPKKTGGKPRLKRYESEFEGVTLQDIWIDINKIHNQSDPSSTVCSEKHKFISALGF